MSNTSVLNEINEIASKGFEAVKDVHIQRHAIMEAVKKAAKGEGSKLDASVQITIDNQSTTISLGCLANVDISTGAGALVLDDALQEMSTIEQAAAQLVAAENKAQKQVHSVTGQG